MNKKQKRTHKYREQSDDCQRGGRWTDGQMSERGVGNTGLGYGMGKLPANRYRIGSIASGILVALYEDRWWLRLCEHSIVYKLVQSPCCAPDTNIVVCQLHLG